MAATLSTEAPSVPQGPLSAEEVRKIDAYWRAANYLSVGQIYLFDNPLLTEPLRAEHTKPRLLGHFGTTPGLNFIYVHANRIIKKYDLNMIYICGPGHGGPGMVANTWMEGTYSEFFPNIGRLADQRLREVDELIELRLHIARRVVAQIHLCRLCSTRSGRASGAKRLQQCLQCRFRAGRSGTICTDNEL